MEELESSLKSLGLSGVPRQPGTHPDLNPVDVYRSHVTALLEPITGVDAKIIYPAIQWTVQMDKGDLVLAVPALRIKGKKPDALAQEIAEKVADACASPVHASRNEMANAVPPPNSSPSRRSSKPPKSQAASCSSGSSRSR